MVQRYAQFIYESMLQQYARRSFAQSHYTRIHICKSHSNLCECVSVRFWLCVVNVVESSAIKGALNDIGDRGNRIQDTESVEMK